MQVTACTAPVDTGNRTLRNFLDNMRSQKLKARYLTCMHGVPCIERAYPFGFHELQTDVSKIESPTRRVELLPSNSKNDLQGTIRCIPRATEATYVVYLRSPGC